MAMGRLGQAFHGVDGGALICPQGGGSAPRHSRAHSRFRWCLPRGDSYCGEAVALRGFREDRAVAHPVQRDVARNWVAVLVEAHRPDGPVADVYAAQLTYDVRTCPVRSGNRAHEDLGRGGRVRRPESGWRPRADVTDYVPPGRRKLRRGQTRHRDPHPVRGPRRLGWQAQHEAVGADDRKGPAQPTKRPRRRPAPRRPSRCRRTRTRPSRRGGTRPAHSSRRLALEVPKGQTWRVSGAGETGRRRRAGAPRGPGRGHQHARIHAHRQGGRSQAWRAHERRRRQRASRLHRLARQAPAPEGGGSPSRSPSAA